VCTGTMSNAQDGVTEATCHVMVLAPDYKADPADKGPYAGTKVTYKKKEYIITGQKITFVPESAAKPTE
jgi:hypothetical protein